MPHEILSLPPPSAHLRVAYGKERSQFVDFRFPASNVAAAIVIMIHGGFWRQRYDLAHAGHLCAAVTACGLTTANVEYRRVGEPGGGWPGTFDDIQAALHSAQKHHGNDKPALVVGHSAGGHLGLWGATRRQDLAAEADPGQREADDRGGRQAAGVDCLADRQDREAPSDGDHAGGEPALALPDGARARTAATPLQIFVSTRSHHRKTRYATDARSPLRTRPGCPHGSSTLRPSPPDRAARNLVAAADQRRHRGLAGTRVTNKGDRLTWLYMQVDQMKNYYYGEIEVSIFLRTDVTEAQRSAIDQAISSNPLLPTQVVAHHEYY